MENPRGLKTLKTRRHERRRGLQINPIKVLQRLARPVGFVVLVLAVALLLCALVGMALTAIGDSRPIDEGSGIRMLFCAGFTALCGLGLRRWGDDLGDAYLTRRDAVVMTSLVWLAAGFFGAVPFVVDAGMSPADGFFEAISGFTTTGATVVTDIEGSLSVPLLLWRSLTQWLGGMGIIVLFVALFPGLGAGGKHLFRAEVPGPSPDSLRPRITDTAVYLWGMYLALTVAEVFALAALGMSWFEAVCHALTTVSTGGFSTRDASVAAFDSPAIEMVIALFMLLAGVNFGLYYAALRARRVGVIVRSLEFRVYVGLVAGVSVALIAMNYALHGSIAQSARYSIFTVATFITSTGYGTEDYMLFGPAPLMLVFLLMFIGGCAGSTAGGLKVSRVVVTMKALWSTVKHQVRPNVVHVVRLGRTPQPPETLIEVLAFVCVFMVCLGGGTLAITLLETESTPGSAFGATLTCLSNMGPAPYHPGADNFAEYGVLSKFVFSFQMVAGRLEFLTLLALGLPSVWRP